MIKYNQISIKNHNEVVRVLRRRRITDLFFAWAACALLASLVIYLCHTIGKRDKEIAIYQEDLFSCQQQLIEIKFYGTTDQQVILNGE